MSWLLDRRGPRVAVLLATTTLIVLAACAEPIPGEPPSGPPSMLAPAGLRAARIADLWWVMFWLATAVFVAVIALLLYAVFHPRREQADGDWERADGTRLIVWGGIVLPIIILTAVLTYTVRTLGVLAAPPSSPALVVDVIGYQYWWEVRYPDEGIITANEIHIPVGQPVQINLTSVDVIHSFWVPELAGKLDLIPGKTNSYWLQADRPGVYYGQCAEYCGIQHAKMALLVVAEPADELAAWLNRERRPAVAPTDPLAAQGLSVFLNSSCVYCHAIGGTTATARVGPDLTHLASRRTLAAATLDNTTGNLMAWIVEPQTIKPGNKMPPTRLDAPSLRALVAYLESLR